MAVLIAILGLVVVAGGFLSLTQATMGAGIVGVGCALLIVARLVQASGQHKELRELLEKFLPPVPPAA